MNEFVIFLYLALNIIKEAPNDPVEAQKAITHVTLNRSVVCENSSAEKELRRKYQYSWTNKDEKGKRNVNYVMDLLDPSSFIQLAEAVHTASVAYAEHKAGQDPTGGALYYHAKYMDPFPKWAQYKVALPYHFQGSHILYLGNNAKQDKEFCEKPLIPLQPGLQLVKKDTDKEAAGSECDDGLEEKEQRAEWDDDLKESKLQRATYIRKLLHLMSNKYQR